jgi:ATP-dependent helicase/nuclease subunit B
VEGRGRQLAVIDYKSSAKRMLDLGQVFWGLSLQLPTYAVVMASLWESVAGEKAQPIAALYVPLGMSREPKKEPEEIDAAPGPDEDAFYQIRPPRGIVDADGASELDASVAPMEDAGGKSAWYKIGKTQKGELLLHGDMLWHEEFETVLAYTRWKIAALADALMDGQIVASPCREGHDAPCDTCDYLSLCPFDRSAGSYRELRKIKRKEAVALMQGAMRGDGGTAGGAN